jgi:dienelactone hydrolase
MNHRMLLRLGSVLAAGLLLPGGAAEPATADRDLEAYCRTEVGQLADACFADVRTLADWQAQRAERRRQLFEMLGLWPIPARTDLRPVVTRRIERDAFTVENLHYQSLPGLYVTANLYLPRGLSNPAPTILYVCGHAEVKTNGVSLGNKTAYQHHGAWFARHGYVCLILDTLQLGEIQGEHHGTYRLGRWWWNARGYTPAGVEAWNSIRALDYLESRPEVDRTRIGMTGRSGGGSYTWTTAALDDRVRVAAPVAGITDLRNQVVDGCVDGHCDCMFFLNTYRWDFPLAAALLAPRPLLIVNSDADDLFPLDGVERLHASVKRIYELHGATNRLGLVIAPGPHKDTQDLQVPVLRWFNRHLKDQDPLVEDAATRAFNPDELQVFESWPPDAINARIPETFVPRGLASPISPGEVETVLSRLRTQVFGGWPSKPGSLNLRRTASSNQAGLRWQVFDWDSQNHVPLRLYLAEPTGGRRPRTITLHVLDVEDWTQWQATFGVVFAALLQDQSPGRRGPNPASVDLPRLAREWKADRAAHAWFAPRGIGSTAWSGDERRQTQIRRRFMLLGQTLDGMRVWDIRRAVQAVRALPDRGSPRLILEGRGTMGANVLYASLFEAGIAELNLQALPASHREGPDYLNVLRWLDISQASNLAQARLVPAKD